VTETLVRMPKLADTLVDGTVGQWLKRVGETVQSGEPLASIETDKVTTELTSPANGTVLELLVAEGQTVAIETPIARLGSSPLPPGEAARSAGEGRKVTPLAARLLAEHGLSPEAIAPTPARRITRDDVLAHVAQQKRNDPLTPTLSLEGEGTPASVAPLPSMRRAIAEHMALARQTIPHGQCVMAADLTQLVVWRERHKADFLRTYGAPLTFTVLFVHALASQLEPPANVGVAVALDNGLIAPVLRAAHDLSLGETARGIADLAGRARGGQLAPDATHGAAMTVTNVGSFGNVTAAPIVPVGQLGILGPGVVERRPLPAADGGIRLGWQCLLSLVYDRRAFDELAADRFLRRVVDALTSMPTDTSPEASPRPAAPYSPPAPVSGAPRPR